MAYYRKKPIVVEAEQWFPGKQMIAVRGDKPDKICGCVITGGPGSKPHVHTIHAGQTILLEPGDWIITEPDGAHYYVCKDAIFQVTYEPFEQT